MIHDFACWRDDPAFVREQMNTARAIHNAWTRYLNSDGLIQAPRGWNFTDWVPDWPDGIPPEGERGVSAILNMHFLLALTWIKELEETFGDPELAARASRQADALWQMIESRFWNESRGLHADTADHTCFSEHANALAVVTGKVSPDRMTRIADGLRHAPDLSRTTVYFSHYLFEAYAALDMIDLFFERLVYWKTLRNGGFKTTPEMPEPSRSDCHAWGAHPLYHATTALLGIRPVGFGFRKVHVEPQLGPLQWLRGKLPHPGGDTIAVSAKRQTDGRLVTETEIPEGLEICAEM
jgi:hypothetical protein